mmetsp:Transcript_15892/g.25829  ORF Transcript_15892/g.25829 Transcript_15892/m.25829 type:complete len:155 (-) Transcript_15892:377-841(-)
MSFDKAVACSVCGKRMGFIGACRGFGWREFGHEERCKARQMKHSFESLASKNDSFLKNENYKENKRPSFTERIGLIAQFQGFVLPRLKKRSSSVETLKLGAAKVVGVDICSATSETRDGDDIGSPENVEDLPHISFHGAGMVIRVPCGTDVCRF